MIHQIFKSSLLSGLVLSVGLWGAVTGTAVAQDRAMTRLEAQALLDPDAEYDFSGVVEAMIPGGIRLADGLEIRVSPTAALTFDNGQRASAKVLAPGARVSGKVFDIRIEPATAKSLVIHLM